MLACVITGVQVKKEWLGFKNQSKTVYDEEENLVKKLKLPLLIKNKNKWASEYFF